jgi:hypothetical protein
LEIAIAQVQACEFFVQLMHRLSLCHLPLLEVTGEY